MQYMHICMFAHKLTLTHRRVCEAISHTPPPTVWRTICACVWSYSLILYGRICNQTSPLLRASSLSCLSNLTQMQAEEENNEKQTTVATDTDFVYVDGCELFTHEASAECAVACMVLGIRECVPANMCVQLLL